MPPTNVTVGVVIPAFQSERFIGSTVRSLLSQDFDDWRCVVIDDGSPDDVTGEAMKAADGDRRFTFIRQPNAGVAAARTRGALELGDWPKALLFLDADDELTPVALSLMTEALARHNLGAVCGEIRRIDANGNYLAPGTQQEELRLFDLANTFEENPCPTTSGWLWRRTAFDRAGGWKPGLAIAEDWHLVNRVVATGRVGRVPAVVVKYRQHDGSATRSFGQSAYTAIRQMRVDIYCAAARDVRGGLRAAWRRIHLERCLAATRARQPKAAVKHALLVVLSRPVTRPRRPGWLS